MAKSTVRPLLYLGIAGLLAACAPDTEMSGQNNRSPTEPPKQTAEATADTPPPPAAVEQNGKIINHSVERDSERLVETFAFPAVERITDTFENPREPLTVRSFTWDPSDPEQRQLTVAAGGPGSDTFTKTAPDRRSDSSLNAEVAIIAIVDSSESFAAVADMKERAKLALDEVVGQLHTANLNYQFVVCGLEGATGNIEVRSLLKGALTEAQAKAAVRQAADEVFSKTGSGSEKLFRSAKLCADKLPTTQKIQARAARGYLFITDAPNCKNNDNQDATTECDRSDATKADSHLHLWSTSGLGASRHLSALSVLYRRTNGVCGNADAIESPNANETLTDSSQYAEAVKRAHETLYPAGAGAPNAFGSLIGDVCADTYGVSAATELVRTVKDIRSHRLLLSRTYSNFPLHPAYNIDVKVEDAASAYVVRDGVVVAANEGVVTAVHHTTNSYDRLNFTLAADPEPASSVEVFWDGAAQANLSCPSRSDFGVPVAFDCRWSGKILYFRNIEALPATDPVSVKTKAFNARYTKAVQKTKTLSFTASEPVISASISTTSHPAGFATRLPSMTTTLSNNDRTVTLQYGADDLPPGDYVVQFRTNVQRSYAHNVSLADNQAFVCFKGAGNVTLDAGGFVLDALENALACTLSQDGSSVIFRGSGLSPIAFKVGLKARVADAPFFSLTKAPDVDAITVKTFNWNDAARADSTFAVDGLKVQLGVALAPGERAEATYQRTPPQPGPDFPLTDAAVDDSYRIELVRDGVVEPLVRGTDFDVAPTPTGTATLTLLRVVEPGAIMVVRYTVKDEHDESTTEQAL